MIRVNRAGAALGAAIFLSVLIPVPSAAQQRPLPAVEEEPQPISPRGAFLRSLVLPGWGQAYVGAPNRGAVYFALAGGSLWMSYVAKTQLRAARNEELWLRETGQIEPEEETEFALARARHFEDWAALSIFLMFLSGADAYVAAYLSDFEERIGVLPESNGTIRFEARVPTRGGF